MSSSAKLLAALAVVAAAAAALFLWLRESTPVLELKEFRRAQDLWQRQGYEDYTLTVRKDVDRMETERLVTTVRAGRAVAVSLNGAPLPVSDTYSVEGLFETMEREVEMAQEPQRQEGQPRNAVLRALFHAELGVPVVFKRLASRGTSFLLTVEKLEAASGEVLFSR